GLPGKCDGLPVVAKECEVELEAAAIRQFDDLAHLAETSGRPIGRQAHDLVFVAVMRKSQVLRQRLVKDAERMREMDPALDPGVAATPDAPGGAGEVAKPVDRDDRGFLERRQMKGRRQMGQMMLDLVKPGAKSFAAEAGGKELWNVL